MDGRGELDRVRVGGIHVKKSWFLLLEAGDGRCVPCLNEKYQSQGWLVC